MRTESAVCSRIRTLLGMYEDFSEPDNKEQRHIIRTMIEQLVWVLDTAGEQSIKIVSRELTKKKS